MSKQPLRGSLHSKLFSIAETLKVALKSARNEQELRNFIMKVINNIEKTYQKSNQ